MFINFTTLVSGFINALLSYSIVSITDMSPQAGLCKWCITPLGIFLRTSNNLEFLKLSLLSKKFIYIFKSYNKSSKRELSLSDAYYSSLEKGVLNEALCSR